jgi:hypothetical protein
LHELHNRAPVQKPIAESLSGLIERVTFFNEENGFAVLKVKAKGHRDQITVVGSLPSVSAGEWLTAEGRWVQDREFGLQFRADLLNSTAPTTKEGIEKYLGSGMVKGIGPVYAKKLVDRFGEQIFDVIETQSAKLEELDGIGPKRRKRIKDAWAEQKVIRQIMVFLHSNGVSTSRAVRIFKTYGETAIEKVQANGRSRFSGLASRSSRNFAPPCGTGSSGTQPPPKPHGKCSVNKTHNAEVDEGRRLNERAKTCKRHAILCLRWCCSKPAHTAGFRIKCCLSASGLVQRQNSVGAEGNR